MTALEEKIALLKAERDEAIELLALALIELLGEDRCRELAREFVEGRE